MSDLARHCQVLGIKADLVQLLSCPETTVINLTNRSLGLESLRMVLSGMEHGMPIRVLNLAGNALGDAGCALIAQMLRGNESLETLDLSDANITCLGAQHLQRLEGHPRLKHLYLSNNDIGAAGGFALSQLCSAAPITSLNLNFNAQLGDTGVEMLARAISQPTSKLEQLSINGVGATHRGIWALTRALELHHTQLRTLYCVQGAGAVDERDLEGLQAAFERRAPGGRLVVHLNPLQQSSGREHAPTAGQRGSGSGWGASHL
eukprot:jgi/Tetstr1/455833/TSEL_042625.t1